MWLINTNTLQLEHIIDPEESNKKYAILSHTWEHEEVSFQQFQDLDLARTMAGFAKIQSTCILAQARGLDYAWVDTCCIDKSSSAELSEAINSMFNYYKNASVCFAYLSDFPNNPLISLQRLENSGMSEADFQAHPDLQAFRNCRWFTRGWTLQELIAPEDLLFYNSAWQSIGGKRTLSGLLSTITGIDRGILMGTADPFSVPACVRMSWAAKRDTTRVEDIAYCLLGIFDVNLPLIYGEGYKAFQRLQEEILRANSDLSILSWSSCNPVPLKYIPALYKDGTAIAGFRGPFAWAPSEFSGVSKELRTELLRFSPVRIELINGAIEVSVRDGLSLIWGSNTFLSLITPGSGASLDHSMIMTPLGYAFLNESNAKLDEEGLYPVNVLARKVHPQPHPFIGYKFRIISHQDAMRFNRNNYRVTRYFLNSNALVDGPKRFHRIDAAWPDLCFNDLNGNGTMGMIGTFTYAWPRVHHITPFTILGATIGRMTIFADLAGTDYDLGFVFCCGAVASDQWEGFYEPWGVTFCLQSTEKHDREVFGFFAESLGGPDESRYEEEICEILERHYGAFAHNRRPESIIKYLQAKTHTIEYPSHKPRKPRLRYSTRWSYKQGSKDPGSTFEFDIHFEGYKSGKWESLQPLS